MPSKIKKRGNSYLLTVVHERKEYTKTIHVDKKSEAEKAWTIFASEIIQGKVVSSKEGSMSLDQFYAYWLDNYAKIHLEPTTITFRQNLYQRIGAALGHLKLCNIKKRHVVEFVKKLSQKNSPSTGKPLSGIYVKRHLDFLRLLFNYAIELEFISVNPADNVKVPKASAHKKEMPTEQDFATFLTAVENHPNVKYRLWVALAFMLGLRKEEIFGLKWSDIDTDNKTISIQRAVVYTPSEGTIVKDTKTKNSTRSLPLPDSIVKLVVEWRREQLRKKVVFINKDCFVFSTFRGTVASPWTFNSFLTTLSNKLGIPRITPHVLRHMYGTYLLAAGINIATISSLMGHADSSFTLSRYVHELKSLEVHTAQIMDNTMKQLTNKNT